MENMVMMTYFSFTSLSTVGLGDYHPRGNKERAIAAFMMIVGVLMTSLIMENLNRMLFTLKESNKEYEEYGNLNLFINVLARFNGDVPIDQKLDDRIVQYFKFRWAKNKNNWLATQPDMDMLAQLPKKTQDQIFVNFTFQDIRMKYNRYLKHLKIKANTILSEELLKEELNGFMAIFFRMMEPILFDPTDNIVVEGMDFDSVFFPTQGSVKVGFDCESLLLNNGLEK